MGQTIAIGTAFDFKSAGSAPERLSFIRVTVKRMRRAPGNAHLPAALQADWFVICAKMPDDNLLRRYHFLALFLRPD
jgi:hypothetical protein